MKKLLITLLFVSTPVLASDESRDAIERMQQRTNENIQRMLETPDPVIETEHYYQFRSPEGDVSRGWARRLDR